MMNRNARLKENQEVFRSANEGLSDVLEAGLAPADSVPFLCECADEKCMGRIDLSSTSTASFIHTSGISSCSTITLERSANGFWRNETATTSLRSRTNGSARAACP
jgi:hypothetical protein